MSNLFNLIGPSGAEDLFIDRLRPSLRREKSGLREGRGRVLAENIISPINLPPFRRSTMDGYAIRSEDTVGASESNNIYLDLKGKIMMGEEAQMEVGAREAIEISTGGMLPKGADGVLMVEYTEEVCPDLIEISRSVASGENIIAQGEDVRKGQQLLKEGHRLRSQDIGALAGLGITEFEVFARPKVTIFSTGDELVDPKVEAQVGQIRDMNSYSVGALLEEMGVEMNYGGIIRDDKDELEEKVRGALEGSDLIILSGGSSVGTKDFTVDLLNRLGDPGILVHGVAIKPGKPTILALAGDTPIIGLPGHPAAVINVFNVIARPIVETLMGLKREERIGRSTLARVSRNISSGKGREEYIRVRVERREDELIAVPILGKSSLITTMVEGDGVIKIGIGSEGIEEGSEVEVLFY